MKSMFLKDFSKTTCLCQFSSSFWFYKFWSLNSLKTYFQFVETDWRWLNGEFVSL